MELSKKLPQQPQQTQVDRQDGLEGDALLGTNSLRVQSWLQQTRLAGRSRDHAVFFGWTGVRLSMKDFGSKAACWSSVMMVEECFADKSMDAVWLSTVCFAFLISQRHSHQQFQSNTPVLSVSVGLDSVFGLLA